MIRRRMSSWVYCLSLNFPTSEPRNRLRYHHVLRQFRVKIDPGKPRPLTVYCSSWGKDDDQVVEIALEQIRALDNVFGTETFGSGQAWCYYRQPEVRSQGWRERSCAQHLSSFPCHVIKQAQYLFQVAREEDRSIWTSEAGSLKSEMKWLGAGSTLECILAALASSTVFSIFIQNSKTQLSSTHRT